MLHDIKIKLYVVFNSILRLKPTTSYTKVNTPTIRIGPFSLRLCFHVYCYCIYCFIHTSSNERDVYHASHVMHERQMAIMHHMHFMHYMHDLYPPMHHMHGGTYLNGEREDQREICMRYQSNYVLHKRYHKNRERREEV